MILELTLLILIVIYLIIDYFYQEYKRKKNNEGFISINLRLKKLEAELNKKEAGK